MGFCLGKFQFHLFRYWCWFLSKPLSWEVVPASVFVGLVRTIVLLLSFSVVASMGTIFRVAALVGVLFKCRSSWEFFAVATSDRSSTFCCYVSSHVVDIRGSFMDS